jgi:hypothetical protein
MNIFKISNYFKITEEQLINAIKNNHNDIRTFSNKDDLVKWLYNDYSVNEVIININNLMKASHSKKTNIYDLIISDYSNNICMFKNQYYYIFDDFII